MAAILATPAQAATLTQLKAREHRQQMTLHSNQGTLRFFRHHRWLTRGRTRPIAMREIRRAQVWVAVVRRELAETRAAIRPDPAPSWLTSAFLCIHRYEGAWNANTGNGYHGGLQMDWNFMTAYGPEYVQRWGGAENWPAWAQIAAAIRAYSSGRGFAPWPNTSRACGLR